MDNTLALWSALIGAVLPPLIAVVQQKHWNDTVRALVTVVVCIVAGAGQAYAEGKLSNAKDVASIIVVILTAAWVTYNSFWKPSGIAPVIERATSPKEVGP